MMMRVKIKKPLVIFIGLLLCIMILPTSASAESNEARYQQSQGGEWITGSFSDACENVYDGGVIELLSDVELISTQTISKSVTITSSNQDAPCCISAASQNHGYLLSLEGAVVLKHIVLDGGSESGISATRALVSVNAGGSTVTISDGAVLQNNNNLTQNGAGGGLCLISGSVQMDGGTIRNCSAQVGGGVAIVNSAANEFILGSGSITENNAWGDSYRYGGGGIYIAAGTFEMDDGIISKNCGYVGGAVFINNPSGAYLKMTGGNMTENQAKYGGGIYSSQIRLIELYGGNITGNVADIRGGGVFISPIGKVKLQGQVVVDSNFSEGDNAFNNFFIEGNPENSSFKADIQIVGSLEGAKIGVSTMFDPAAEEEGKLYIIDTDGSYSIKETDFEVFDSDDEAYHILKSENRLYLQPHSYSGWQSDGGGHWKTCECGIKTNIEPHQGNEGTTIKEPSCDETGIIEYECSICGYKHEQELSLRPHTVQHHQGNNSTCTEYGNIEYWHCDVCGKYFSDEALTEEISKEETVIEYAGHKIELQDVKEATCTEEGYTGDKVCVVCGDVIERGSVIPKIPHDFENGQCTVCGCSNESSQEPGTGGADSYKPADKTSPETGDDSDNTLWIILLLASVSGVVAAAVNKKRRSAK